MFIWPDGSVTGSINWTELEGIASRRDDDTVTAEGYDALQRFIDERNGVLRDAAAEEDARAEAAAKEHEAAVAAPAEEQSQSPEESDDFDATTVEDLKSKLKSRGLPTSGNKAELWERLNEADDSEEE